jgi:hypothetical protein
MPPAEGINAAFNLRNVGRFRQQLYGEFIISPNAGKPCLLSPQASLLGYRSNPRYILDEAFQRVAIKRLMKYFQI